MIGLVLVVVGALCVAVEAALVVIDPNALTIGLLVLAALMFVVNFAAWRVMR